MQLIGKSGAPEKEGVIRAARKITVPSQNDPVFHFGPVHDVLIGLPAGVLGVLAEESEISGQPADHFVGEPTRGRHDGATKRNAKSVASKLYERNARSERRDRCACSVRTEFGRSLATS